MAKSKDQILNGKPQPSRRSGSKLCLLLFAICLLNFLFACHPVSAQNYTDIFLSAINRTWQAPCGGSGTVTQQIANSLASLTTNQGGTLDLDCYQQAISITSDIFSPVSVPVTIFLPAHTVTVNANATIPANFMICSISGGSISAGVGFTLTNNALACFGAGGPGEGTVVSFSAGNLSPLFTTSVTSPTTTPALSFTLSDAPADSWFGNAGSSPAAPAFNTTTLPTSLFPANIPSNAATANALAATPAQCSSPDYSTGIAASGAANCSQVEYSQISGTPSLSGYAPINSPTFTGTVTIPSGAALGTPASINLADATFPGTISSNTTGNAATATDLQSTPSQCSGSQFATGIAASGNANCATPAGSGNVSNSGTPSNGQYAQWINATQIEGVSFPTPCSGGQFSLGFSGGSNNCSTPAGGGNVSNSGTPAAGEFAEWINSTQIEGITIPPYYCIYNDSDFNQDDTATIQACVNEPGSPGGTVLFAAGRPNIETGPVIVPPGVKLIGMGTVGGGPGTGGPQLSTVTFGCGTAHKPCFKVGTPSTAHYQPADFENFAMQDTTSGNNAAGGICSVNISYERGVNLSFYGFNNTNSSSVTPSPTATTGTGSLPAGTYYIKVSEQEDCSFTLLSSSAPVTLSSTGEIKLTYTDNSWMGNYDVWISNSGASGTYYWAAQASSGSQVTITSFPSGTLTPATWTYDKSYTYGITGYATSGYEGEAYAYVNQVKLSGIQTQNGGVSNPVVFDTNVSASTLEGNTNLNLGSNTGGCGVILQYATGVFHTEAGGSGSKRACLDGVGGDLVIETDLETTGESGVVCTGCSEWNLLVIASVESGSPETVSLDSNSSYNHTTAFGYGASKLIYDLHPGYNVDYDFAAMTANIPLLVTFEGLTNFTQTAPSSNCGSLSGSTACIVTQVGGTTSYVPYWQ